MIAGFALARALPVWALVCVFLGVEVGLAYAIRDNLTLNIIMLVYPLDIIKTWQSGG